jgi:alkaline phosphatase
MPTMLEGRGDFLPNATKLALETLSKNKEGFFLMIEGSQIDWGGHENNADYLISELIDFDKTIGVALDFASQNGETLVIVTADHETGGFTLASDEGDYNKIKPTFSTGGHSATMVPVFSKGPSASLFSGIYENTAIYSKMITLFLD